MDKKIPQNRIVQPLFKDEPLEERHERPPSLVEKMISQALQVFKPKTPQEQEITNKEKEIQKIMGEIKHTITTTHGREENDTEERIAEDVYKQLIAQQELSNIKGARGDIKSKTSTMTLHQIREFRKKNNRYPVKNEYNDIVDNVFDEMKNEFEIEEEAKAEKEKQEKEAEKSQAKEDRKKEIETKKSGKNEQKPGKEEKNSRRKEKNPIDEIPEFEEAELTPGDLFGEGSGKKDKKSKEESDDSELPEEFETNSGQSNLEEDEFNLGKDLENLAGEDLEADVESLETDLENEEKSKCPNCKTVSEEIIVCPECGSGFCSHCAKAVKPLGKGKTQYTCPKCKKAFKAQAL